MQFTLITRNGKVHTFFVRAVAELYQQIYGGELISAAAVTEYPSKVEGYSVDQ